MVYTFNIPYYLSLTIQSLLCKYNNDDIRKISNIVYLHKIFNGKIEVYLLHPQNMELLQDSVVAKAETNL